MTSDFMVIEYTPKQQKAAAEHWAKVRAGSYQSDAHVFKDNISHLIEMERFKAQKSIEAAAAHMRHVEQLCSIA